MAPEVRIAPEGLNCPSCGAPLPARNPGIRAQTCAYCGSVILWDEEGHRDSGKRSMLPEGFTRLYTGATGTLKGQRFEVLGRVRYGFERGFWDEWYIRYEDGAHAWVTEDDHLLCVETETPAVVPGELGVGQVVPIADIPFLILEVGRTTCLGIEGQVPSEVLPDETYAFADGASVDGKRTVGIEFDDQPPTVFVGDRLDHDDVVMDDEGEDW